MSALAPQQDATQRASSADQLTETWKHRIQHAKQARKPYIPVWLMNLAFAAGQHWVAWDRKLQRLRSLRELDPKYADRELFTADRITEYRMAELGELENDDDRPQLITTQEGDDAAAAAEQLNRAIAYAWDHEWNAQEAIKQARLYCLDLGVSALRCRWDPSKGPIRGHLPVHQSGQPVTNPDDLAHLQAYGQLPDGTLPHFQMVNEGRTCWESYSPFGILAPPGVNHEKDFPWEALVRPLPIDDLIERYGDKASQLQEDPDIASAMGLTTAQGVPDARSQGIGLNRLRGHVWVYTCFQRPCPAYPKGAVTVLASNEYKLLDFQDQLPYQLANGEYHTGVTYLHWYRLNDRFYSRAFIEPLKDIQRLINRRETQNTEIIDRGMPGWFVRKGDLPESPAGNPMEMIELDKNAQEPVPKPGIGPGAWMYEDIAHQIDNLGHASTLAAIRLGENPEGVDTYSQLALLNDNETSKRITIIRDQRMSIATLVELGVHDIKTYWPAQKEILIAGEDDQIDAATFLKEKIPTFYMAKVAEGAPEPRSQGALLKQVDAIWAAAVQSWVAVQDGNAWVGWYKASTLAGEPLDLPQAKANTQQQLAEYENELMVNGENPPVMDYDNLQVHLPAHREAQDMARAQQDTRTLAIIVAHIKEHQAVAQQNVQNAALVAQGLQPTDTGETPDQQPDQGQGEFANYTPRPREPYPQMVGHDFSALAAGQ